MSEMMQITLKIEPAMPDSPYVCHFEITFPGKGISMLGLTREHAIDIAMELAFFATGGQDEFPD